MTLQQRIAALNAAHIGRVPGEPPPPVQPVIRPTPQIPTRRPDLVKTKSVNNPPEQLNGSVTDTVIGNRPAPPPLPTRKKPPALPTRKDTQVVERRPSRDSNHSAYTTSTTPTSTSRSTSSDRIKAPAWGDCELPVLPPKGQATAPRKYSTERPKYVNRAPSSTTTISTVSSIDSRRPSDTPIPPVPALPPRLPPRKVSVEQHEQPQEPRGRKIPPVATNEYLARAQRSALSFGMNRPKAQEVAVEDKTPSPVEAPPPIPLASRPDLSAIQATKPRASDSTSAVNGALPSHGNVCLVCRDFSGPDHHASLFPRQTVRSLQDLGYQLTAPFPSPTDKARAIFKWLHFNVRYDVDNFFGGTVKGSTPQSTLQSGLAVCEGYAALFTNLATHAGLESIVISGHGKGYGYSPLAPGSPLPPYNAGHAWNAVKIDNGEWKLIDACWGAGHVQGKGMPYIQEWNPTMFSMSNEEFGIKHFPGNKEHFFLPGGRRLSWEEYITINPSHWPDHVEAPTVYTTARSEYYIGEKSVCPRNKHLSVIVAGMTRFQFNLQCPHWTLDRHGDKGPPPVFVMMIQGLDGRAKDIVPLEHIRGGPGGGDTWYVDIPSRDLGAPGQTITLFAVNRFGDREGDHVRGMSVEEFRQGKGRVGMGFAGVAAWELVA
jgi:transglutaminase-like putative cysteine protease